jgi:hypothetical protein
MAFKTRAEAEAGMKTITVCSNYSLDDRTVQKPGKEPGFFLRTAWAPRQDMPPRSGRRRL